MRHLFMFCLLALSACNPEYGFQLRKDHPNAPQAPAEPAIETIEEEWVQQEQKQIDILWAIDNSCSMGNKQQELANNFPLLREQIENSGWDWRVGAISLDTYWDSDGGRLHPMGDQLWMDPNNNVSDADFATTVNMGLGARSAESGFDATWLAIQAHGNPSEFNIDPGLPATGDNCYWKDSTGDGELDTVDECFYRKYAGLHVIVVSDEPDQSVLNTQEFINWMKSLKTNDAMVTFSLIGWGTQAEYHVAVEELNGYAGWIFGDWTTAATDMTDVFTGYSNTYPLKHIPADGSLEVFKIVGGNSIPMMHGECTECWTYDSVPNVIVLHGYTPREDERIKARYINRATTY